MAQLWEGRFDPSAPIMELGMSTIFVRHPVADYEAWRAGFDEHGSVRREYGLTDVELYRDADNPDHVTILMTTDDVSRAKEFLGSEDLKEAMSRLGVTAAPESWIADEA